MGKLVVFCNCVQSSRQYMYTQCDVERRVTEFELEYLSIPNYA